MVTKFVMASLLGCYLVAGLTHQHSLAHRAGNLDGIRRVGMNADGVGAHGDILAVDAFGLALRDRATVFARHFLEGFGYSKMLFERYFSCTAARLHPIAVFRQQLDSVLSIWQVQIGVSILMPGNLDRPEPGADNAGSSFANRVNVIQ